jgi:hypothetical protein
MLRVMEDDDENVGQMIVEAARWIPAIVARSNLTQ